MIRDLFTSSVNINCFVLPESMILILKSLVAGQCYNYNLRLLIKDIIKGIIVEGNPILLYIMENNNK